MTDEIITDYEKMKRSVRKLVNLLITHSQEFSVNVGDSDVGLATFVEVPAINGKVIFQINSEGYFGIEVKQNSVEIPIIPKIEGENYDK